MRFGTTTILVLWAATLSVMYTQLVAYGAEPGDPGAPSRDWPRETSIELDSTRWNLVLFAHPRCPCTRATMEEFKRLHAIHHDLISTTVVFFYPSDADAAWVRGAVASSIEEYDDVNVVLDPDGALTEHFGARTSGHVLAYNSSGELRYSGGLTVSRGHEGLSDGTSALIKIISDDTADLPNTLTEYAVFGCPILDADAACFDKGCSP